MKKVLLGCLGVSALFSIAFVAFAVWVFRVLPTLDASLTTPSAVELDSEFTFVVSATNRQAGEVVLDSIDIQNDFLEGFQVVDVSPEPTDEMKIFGMRSWSFGEPVSAGESLDVQFTLRAVEEGHFSGEVDVCNPNQDFETVIADVVVRPSGVEP